MTKTKDERIAGLIKIADNIVARIMEDVICTDAFPAGLSDRDKATVYSLTCGLLMGGFVAGVPPIDDDGGLKAMLHLAEEQARDVIEFHRKEGGKANVH